MAPNNTIPLVDLGAQYSSLKEEIHQAITQVFSDGSFVKSPVVRKFEHSFASYLGTSHCLGVGNGTDALEISLKALGVGPGDEVIVPAMSWIATAAAVSNIGATPVFVDITDEHCTLDPDLIQAAISSRTKSIIPVHLYGCPAQMDKIMDIAREHKLTVVEDCAQAHGALYNGRKVGTLGDVGVFSFFPSKNLGAYGDAGAIVTNNTTVIETCRRISNHGRLDRDDHTLIGRNSRLDGIQAAFLSVKLRYLDQWNLLRQKAATQYKQLLRDLPIQLPTTPANSTHVFHLFPIRSDKRDSIASILSERRIGSGIHYPVPLPFLEPYRNLHINCRFPVANALSVSVLSLPLYPEITNGQIELVAEGVKEGLK